MFCIAAAVGLGAVGAAGEECASPAPRTLRTAMAQIEIIDGDLAENMRRAEEAIRKAAKQGAKLVCLPEAADFGWLYQKAREDALPIPGKYTHMLSGLARELDIWISAGCLEKDGEHVYNSAVLINRGGEVVLKHRKIDTLPFLTAHLYDCGYHADIKTVDTEFGRVGITICADNFNHDNPKRAAELGAWLLIAPHGFAADEDEMEKNARDFQNHISGVGKATGMWVIGTDAVLGRVAGGEWEGKLHSGVSTISNPQGENVAVGKFKKPDLVLYDIEIGGPAEEN